MRGWRFEGHRHALAAKGIKTKAFYSWKDSLANAISKNTADPGQDEIKMANLKAKDEMRGEILQKFHEDVKNDKLRPEKEEDLLQEFGFLARAFTERREMNAMQFRERARDMYKDFRKRNLKTLTIMGVDE